MRKNSANLTTVQESKDFLTPVPTETEIHCIFVWFIATQEKQSDLGKGYWNPKQKLGVTMHFSEIIKLQFGKKFNTLLCILALFRILVA